MPNPHFFPPLPQSKTPNEQWLKSWLRQQNIHFGQIIGGADTDLALNLPEGFQITVLSDNPAVGEDTLAIRAEAQDGLDHIHLGPTSGANYLKRLIARADEFRIDGDGQIRLRLVGSAGGGDILINDILGSNLLVWDESDDRWEFYKIVNWDGIALGSGRQLMDFGQSYGLYSDNVGEGVANTRLWIAGPDEGSMYLGPRGGADFLNNLTIRSQEIDFEWEDAGGDAASHQWPKGILYDFGFASTLSGGTLGVYPANVTELSATATVPANISVTIFVWAWMRVDLTLDQAFAALDATIGGTLPINPALVEQDLTTDTDATSSSSTSHQHHIGASSWNTGAASAGTPHTHPSPATGGGDTQNQSASHTHSHSHGLSGSWHTLNWHGARSFVPTGSTVTIQGRGGASSGTQVYDDGFLMYMVVIN